ncbi:MAG: hypothetical protein Q8942_12785 [Bacillota bacterium]|nr:hypothetical protein [Bacillota bacterium]
MISGENFLVRASSMKERMCYVDYFGLYKLEDISKKIGLDQKELSEIYKSNKAVYDNQLEVYFFEDIENAKNVIHEIMKRIKSDKIGRTIVLTEAEIEYIRQALINEGSNSIHLSNKIKDNIFKKLNS